MMSPSQIARQWLFKALIRLALKLVPCRASAYRFNILKRFDDDGELLHEIVEIQIEVDGEWRPIAQFFNSEDGRLFQANYNAMIMLLYGRLWAGDMPGSARERFMEALAAKAEVR